VKHFNEGGNTVNNRPLQGLFFFKGE